MNFQKSLFPIIIAALILIGSSCDKITTTTLSKTFTTEHPKDSAQMVYYNIRKILDNTDYSKICTKLYEKYPTASKGYFEHLQIECNKVDNIEVGSDTSKFKLVLKFTTDYENGKIEEGEKILDYYTNLVLNK